MESTSSVPQSSGNPRLTVRELVQYPEAKRVTKKAAEESVFPPLVDVELLRLDETCGVCLGDFCDDEPCVKAPSAPASEVQESQGAAKCETDVVEIPDSEDDAELAARRREDEEEDPLRDIGLLTGCAHTYHFFCIEKWGRQRENSCPQCKSRFSWIGRYTRKGERLCCYRVGLKHQKDTAEVTIADYQYQEQHQQQLCRLCSTLIESARDALCCSDQLCLNAFHFVCAGFDALPSGAEDRLERERQVLIESLSNAVVRRINRTARQRGRDEGAVEEEASSRRASRGRRTTAAATPRGGSAPVATPTPSSLAGGEAVSDAAPPSEAPRMLRFYLGAQSGAASLGPAVATSVTTRSTPWLLQRKLDIIKLRQERREALRRQEAIRRMEAQAKVVCSGVSIENSSGADLVEDLLLHCSQLVRRHKGEAPVPEGSGASLPQFTGARETTASPRIESASSRGDGHKKEDARGCLAREREARENGAQGQGRSEEDSCSSFLRDKCEELLQEEAQRRADAKDNLVRAQILLEIDQARTRFCEDTVRTALLKSQGKDGPRDSARTSRMATGGSASTAVLPLQRRERGMGVPVGAEISTPAASVPNEGGADVREKRKEKRRRHAKLKPSQTLVDQVKSCMMPFMRERFLNQGEEYRFEYKRICRHISEGLTKGQEGALLSMTEAERGQYWELNFVQVQTAVQDFFERPEIPPSNADS
ncbi:PHD-zinc finger (c3hc4 type) domain-containing protein [Cyclospora cayetanensis]|uniref:PHD-zinc finger (C3hc4 type) domain-containing protein n=1 Tax=Cyclospora cayetanensis TaxID=88456 RepID=A0A1D3CXD1_9EIME|nr:PHD-zinc finger (c3hc4 type) domain-containing protein [Cyclospora cayetanensis]